MRKKYHTPEQKRAAKDRENRRFYKKYRQRLVVEARAYRAAHPLDEKEKTRRQLKRAARRSADPLAFAQKAKKHRRNYVRTHLDECCARVVRRDALKKDRLHPEHDVTAERALYAEAARRSRHDGQKWTVDHIIPLAKGGWHHHLNLQLLPAVLNSTKNDDPFWEHSNYKCWRDVPSTLWPDELSTIYHEILQIAAA